MHHVKTWAVDPLTWLVTEQLFSEKTIANQNAQESSFKITENFLYLIRSSCPFDDGCYSEHRIWLMTFDLRNLESSSLVKLMELSNTNTWRLSCVANVRHNICSVTAAYGDETSCASIYLLWTCTIARIYLPLIGPAYSKYTPNHALSCSSGRYPYPGL